MHTIYYYMYTCICIYSKLRAEGSVQRTAAACIVIILPKLPRISVNVYIYIYTHMCIYIYIYISVYINIMY